MNYEKTEQPLVTISIATYNGAATIRNVLEGILKIDYPNLEVLIGDDNSSDATVEICHEFQAKMPQMRIFGSRGRLGINANYNRLLGVAEGKYYIIFDQDDERDPSFISKCVAKLELDKRTVLCHSYTEVRWQGKLYHVNTLDSLVTAHTRMGRIYKFLRRPSDINIYGVIRTECIRKAGGWKPGLSNTNRLLFSLILQGRFSQVPETLFSYTAKGLRFRPSNAEEIERSQPNSRRKYLRIPGMRLVLGQFEQIFSSELSKPAQMVATVLLFSNFIVTTGTKLIYRGVWQLRGEETPQRFTRLCARIVYPDDDIQYIIKRADDDNYYAEEWPLRRVPQSIFSSDSKPVNE